jgi:hypothetical protein
MGTSKVPLGEPSGPFLNYCDPGEIAAFALAINDDSVGNTVLKNGWIKVTPAT